MAAKEHTMWTERYRPDTLDNYIGNEQFKSKMKVYLETNDIPHLLLHGIQGVGKCLDYSEEVNIEIELTEKEVEKLKEKFGPHIFI